MLTYKELHRTSIYRKIDVGSICLICPHECLLKPHEVGKCNVRKCSELCSGEIYLREYGNLSLIAVDKAKDKQFKSYVPKEQHDSYKILSCGGFGCSLSCDFCENSKISQQKDFSNGSYFSVESIIDFAKKENVDAICMSYNEPTVYYEYLLDLSSEARENGFKFLLKTNAFVNAEPWKRICESIDAVNIDFKGSGVNYNKLGSEGSYVVYDRIQEAIKYGISVEISIPVYNGIDFKEIGYLANLLETIDKNIGIYILKVNPANKCINSEPTTEKSLKRVKNIFLNRKMKKLFIE